MTISRAGVFAGLLLAASAATAADISPAVVFDMGGKFDKSFNQGVYDGVERFKKETGIEYREFEVTNETQREQALRRCLLYTSPSPRDQRGSRMPSSA